MEVRLGVGTRSRHRSVQGPRRQGGRKALVRKGLALQRRRVERISGMAGRRGLAAAFVGAVLIAGCGQADSFPPVKPVSMNLTDSSTGFGIALTDRLLAKPDAGNVFISPLSATLMLSMAASAAEGSTRASIMTTLGLDPALDPSSQAKLTIDRLMQSDENAQLELAQAVWAQKGLKLNPTYVAQLRDAYRAQIAGLDFTSPGAPKVFHDWGDHPTHH